MTEGSSKGLTWATLAAGLVSAALLVAIGCIRPMIERDAAGNFRSGMPAGSERDGAQPRYLSNESAERARDADPRSAPH